MTAPTPRRQRERQRQPSRKRVEAWAVYDHEGRYATALFATKAEALEYRAPHVVFPHLIPLSAPVRLTDAPDLSGEVKRLRRLLSLFRPTCAHLHHEKKHQHECWEPCPVVALFDEPALKPRPKGRT